MSLVRPCIAVGCHFYNDFDVEPDVRRRVRKAYDEPLSLAVDYMGWNVTKDDIKVGMVAKDEEVWPSSPLRKKIALDVRNSINFSECTLSGREAYPEVLAPLYEEINEIYGTD
jgi:ribonuclease Z